MKSTPQTKFLSKRRNLFVFIFLLAAIAVYSSYGSRQNSRISISGIQLHQDRDFVEKELQGRDYRSFQSSQWEQHWYKQEEADIDVFYDDNGKIHSIKGGRPEIDGADATHWTFQQIRDRLGPPSYGGTGRAIGDESHGYLSYSEHRLLVQRGETTTFVLFKPGK